MPWIYYLKDPRDDSVRYIGMSNDPERRLQEHISEARRSAKTTYKVNWIKSLLFKGLVPAVILVELCTPETAPDTEREHILRAKGLGYRLTNLTDGGEGILNPSEETRSKLSFAARNRSVETRRKISCAQKNRAPCSDETRARISAAQRLRPPVSALTKEKQRVAQKNRAPRSEYTREKASRSAKGRSVSPETRSKMSAAAKLRVASPEATARRSATLSTTLAARRLAKQGDLDTTI